MIALPCGHLLCQPDFEKLGGYLGERPSDRPNEDRRRNNRDSSHEFDPRNVLARLHMMRMIGMPPGLFVPGFGDDEEENETDYEEEGWDDESCPPFERVGGNNNADGDSDDGSMPPLLEPVRPGGDSGSAGGNDNENESDDDSMPPLQRGDGTIASDNEEEGVDDDDDSMPPLMPRVDQTDEEDSGDETPSLTPLDRSGRTRIGNAVARRGSSSSDNSLPPLVQGEQSESEEDESCPSLEKVVVDSSDEDDGPPTPLVMTTTVCVR